MTVVVPVTAAHIRAGKPACYESDAFSLALKDAMGDAVEWVGSSLFFTNVKLAGTGQVVTAVSPPELVEFFRADVRREAAPASFTLEFQPGRDGRFAA